MEGTTLDIFYVIMKEDGIFKSEIMRKFKEFDTNASATKYRNKVDIGVAVLEGTRLIEAKNLGVKEHYFLTEYGLKAKDIVGNLIEEKPDILFGSIIVKQTMSE